MKMLKTGIILFVICAISAVLLAVLNTALADRIKENEKKVVKEGITLISNEEFAEVYKEEKINYGKSDSQVKAKAKITKRYYAEGFDLCIYQVEGTNSFGEAVMLVCVYENVIEEVYIVSFAQTNAAELIKSLPDEYKGKEADKSSILDNAYIKDNYTGGTRGSRMMNLMMVSVIEYVGGAR